MYKLSMLMVVIAIVSVFFWTLFHPGKSSLFQFWGLFFPKESFIYGLTVSARLLSLILISILYVSYTPPEEFVEGLTKLGLPYRVGFSMGLAFRMVPLFYERAIIISYAQKARGLRLNKGGILDRIRLYIPILVPAMISGFRDALNLSMALETRGFGTSYKRVSSFRYDFSVKDVFFIITLTVLYFLIFIYKNQI